MGNFIIPAWTTSNAASTGTFNDPNFGQVTWSVVKIGGADSNGNAYLQVRYTYATISSNVLSAFIQELNASAEDSQLSIACNLVGNVSTSSLTVNCVRTDTSTGWNRPYNLLVSLFY